MKNFDQISNYIDWLLGLSLEAKDIGVARMSLRAFIVFSLAILMIRLGDKRFMGRSTVLDAMLGIVFGAVVSRAITGNAPFFPTIVAGAVLVAMHFVMSAIAFRSHRFGTIVKGDKRQLVKDGELDWAEMKRSHVTEHDIHEQIRADGKQKSIKDLSAAYMERSGEISLLYKDN
jgi:uncharacterized membrane protein YcaP (DUF421 family)